MTDEVKTPPRVASVSPLKVSGDEVRQGETGDEVSGDKDSTPRRASGGLGGSLQTPLGDEVKNEVAKLRHENEYLGRELERALDDKSFLQEEIRAKNNQITDQSTRQREQNVLIQSLHNRVLGLDGPQPDDDDIPNPDQKSLSL